MPLPLDLSHYFDCRRAAFNSNCTRNYPFSPRSPPNAGHTCARTHFLAVYSENNIAVARLTLFVAAATQPTTPPPRSSGIECHGEESFRTDFAWRTSQSTKNSSHMLALAHQYPTAKALRVIQFCQLSGISIGRHKWCAAPVVREPHLAAAFDIATNTPRAPDGTNFRRTLPTTAHHERNNRGRMGRAAPTVACE